MATGIGSHPKDVHFNWISSHIAMVAQEPLNTAWQRYMSTIVTPLRDEDVQQTEKRWLATLTGVTARTLAEMWTQAVIGIGKVPSKSIIENRDIYFRNVA